MAYYLINNYQLKKFLIVLAYLVLFLAAVITVYCTNTKNLYYFLTVQRFYFQCVGSRDIFSKWNKTRLYAYIEMTYLKYIIFRLYGHTTGVWAEFILTTMMVMVIWHRRFPSFVMLMASTIRIKTVRRRKKEKQIKLNKTISMFRSFKKLINIFNKMAKLIGTFSCLI